jgi:hypothetical protein
MQRAGRGPPWAVVVAVICAACGGENAPREFDEAAIDALGDEDPNIPVGENHRLGQPCTLCHQRGGPASSSPFAVAGTVFDGPPDRRTPAAGVIVRIRDADMSQRSVKTNCSGNFFVPSSGWDPAFPLLVGVARSGEESTARVMQTDIGRERSCGRCHRPVVDRTSPGVVVVGNDTRAKPAGCPP